MQKAVFDLEQNFVRILRWISNQAKFKRIFIVRNGCALGRAFPNYRGGILILLLAATHLTLNLCSISCEASESPPPANFHLALPQTADGSFPPLLSQTGAFKDLQHLTTDGALMPYELNISFWSDGASKLRWMALPSNGKLRFSSTNEWIFPNGTVFVKNFELATDETHPEVKRRLETRFLIRDASGGVFGASYKWRADNSDADLLTTNLTETLTIKTATGSHTQEWYYPSRQDCLTCHTANAGLVLGVKTRQLNHDFTYPDGHTDNQLLAWNRLSLFQSKFDEAELPGFDKLAHADDLTRSLEDRARSYLDANCSQCHRPQGTVAYFDARYTTPLPQQNLIEGRVLIDEGIDNARLIAPNDIWRSILFMRAKTTDSVKMPPLAHNAVDVRGIALLRQWIQSLPGPTVLPPPVMKPVGGTYAKPVEVTLQDEPGATIHYTLDGSRPTASDLVYNQPIKLTGPAVVRAKAFKPGFTKSITAQEIFSVGE